ncbi:MAG: hypothetical protein SFW09_09660 [Hyphomicrobiaceae bacterium]|nr:hypothetical protein [Hyphomicrobiaceae bacterium]
MKGLLTKPTSALALGGAIAAIALVIGMLDRPSDGLGLTSFLARYVHIGSAMLWVGMIWFVNFIQLAALGAADDAGRRALMRLVVPRVAMLFRMASHLTLASGIVLLATTGYVLDRLVFPSAVYIPTLRGAMLWGGVIGGLAMWALVHLVIWPSLGVVLDAERQDDATVAAARERLRLAAGVNLVLAVPVTFVMVAAAHIY